MLFVSLIRWWYTDGWRRRAKIVSTRLDGVIDYFSIDLLIKTLFAPFRQISAGKVDGPLGVQMRALADRLISRVIGALIRLILLILGMLTIAAQAIFGLIILVLWLFVPALPIVGVILAVMGWAF
jgi:hypothetical protein